VRSKVKSRAVIKTEKFWIQTPLNESRSVVVHERSRCVHWPRVEQSLAHAVRRTGRKRARPSCQISTASSGAELSQHPPVWSRTKKRLRFRLQRKIHAVSLRITLTQKKLVNHLRHLVWRRCGCFQPGGHFTWERKIACLHGERVLRGGSARYGVFTPVKRVHNRTTLRLD